jgi:alpha-D-xyloside xylohydrolase
MQFHSEPRSGQYGDSNRRDWINDRSPWNMARVNEAPEIVDIYRRYAKLRMKLLPYIYEEAQHCALTSRPLLCHLIYEYQNDEAVLDMEDQYLFGRKLLVAPVVEKDASGREVYLPAGDWFDFWTGIHCEGGRRFTVVCPPGEIPVFSRDGAFFAETLEER